MNPADPPLLAGVQLTRTYRLGATMVPALQGVDVAIHRGEFLIIRGPSGSGKTTLINLLGLLDRPDSGSLLLDGRPVTGLDENALSDLRRDRLGFIFQSFSLIPVLSAAENVAYPMGLKNLDAAAIRRRSHELLDAVGLLSRAAARPDLLSGGERQRVAIARALANEPEVVLADEPTAQLDSAGADAILDLMQKLNVERRVAFVVATHDPRVITRARRVLTLRDGREVNGA